MKTIEQFATELSEKQTYGIMEEPVYESVISTAEFLQRWIPVEEELPELKQVVIAKCEYSSGLISHNVITRIATSQSSNGWQWSGENRNSYFALKVVSWRPLCFL